MKTQLKDFAIFVKYNDGSLNLVRSYKSSKSAINIAKKKNASPYLFFDYLVIKLSTGKILYQK